MEVLYFDNHIVVVNKPAGLTSQESEGSGVEVEMKKWVKDHFQKPGQVFLHAVHRLDKPVSGVLVLAKTSKALARLQETFRLRSHKKIYLALVEGVLQNDSGCLEDYLLHKEFQAEISSKNHPQAKFASLSYTVKQRTKTHSLLEIDLHTGRYHQIRVQLASRGHPIVNDVKYGAVAVGSKESIALHHEKLTISHPVTKQEMTFQAPLITSSAIWTAFKEAPLRS